MRLRPKATRARTNAAAAQQLPRASGGAAPGAFSERVTSLLKRMTIEEMAGQMTQININEVMVDNKNVDQEKVRVSTLYQG